MKPIYLCLLLFFSTAHATTSWLCQPILSIARSNAKSDWVYIANPDGISVVGSDKVTYAKKISSLFIAIHDTYVSINHKKIPNGTWHLVPKKGNITVNNLVCYGPITLFLSPSHLIILARKKLDPIASKIWSLPQQISYQNNTNRNYIIRALIHEISFCKQEPVEISSTQGFIIIDPTNPKKQKNCDLPKLLISHTKGYILVNNFLVHQNRIHIISKDGSIGINGSQFHGSLSIVKKDDRLLIINYVELEEYIYSVLKTESWPGWPLEVNKAFAIASRSYALAIMQQAERSKQPYHLKNTNEHQTYKGIHTDHALRTAVNQTRGIFLTYNQQPALAMFDCCCGGIIPAYMDDFDFKKAPYLARTYPCNHCKRCSLYSWKKEIPLADINTYISHICKKPLRIHDIKIVKKDKAGLVQKLHVKHGKEHQYISGKQFYTAMKEIKSFHFNIQRKKETLFFSGRGFGHHLGICQWGAREMVRDGWPYTRILAFYYPGTTLMKLM